MVQPRRRDGAPAQIEMLQRRAVQRNGAKRDIGQLIALGNIQRGEFAELLCEAINGIVVGEENAGNGKTGKILKKSTFLKTNDFSSQKRTVNKEKQRISTNEVHSEQFNDSKRVQQVAKRRMV